MNAISRSKDDVDIAIEKQKDQPSFKMINENISLQLEMRETDIQKEICNLNPRKAGTFVNIPTKVLKDS